MYPSDLIAAVQAEALRRGVVLEDWQASAALAAHPPWEAPSRRPEREAAAAALEMWRVERGVWV